MLSRLPGVAALLCALPLLAALPGRAQAPLPVSPGPVPRVQAMYTTWDDYYFYAGLQVNDKNVISTNTTPNSEPQQDDDVEVFFATDDARATVRTAHTYQMAVSAGNGAYFSVGDGTTVPKPKLVYTYKYAAETNGTLNNPSDSDIGYTIELAIPWAELGLSGPPADGTTWGFNVISRDRDSMDTPATKFYSLSPAVTSGEDVQDPAKWTRITFVTATEATSESVDQVICPHTPPGEYPEINGSILSGEYPSSAKLSFGTGAILSPAPTVAQEPNTQQSPFSAPPTVEANQTPTAPAPTPPPPALVPQTAQQPAPPATIDLPNGGIIKIVPGGIKNPTGFTPPDQTPSQVATASGPFDNPLAPKVPLKDLNAVEGNPDEADVAPPLGQSVPPQLVMAIYRLDYNGDGRKAPGQNVWSEDGRSLLVDQPINGCGPWFSGLRPIWHEQQLSDLRRAGVDVALLQASPGDPLLGRDLDALVEALKEMKFAGDDYPLIGVAPGQGPDPVWLSHIPAEFRADVGADTLKSAVTVSPGGVEDQDIIGRDTGKTYEASWKQALSASPSDILIRTWNDFTHGTEIAASRQYGESYVDDTHLQTVAFNGNKEWHAKYLKADVPTTIVTKALYEVPVRIENAGTLPWRAGEGYSLCARWYTPEGRLADDSAPRVPIGKDVPPGQTVTLSLGIAARNGYGGDLDPGDYILVIDMVQGQYRWFSFTGDHPLQIRVHVVAAGDASLTPQATFIGTTTPTSGASGETIRGEVIVRNDGPRPWPENQGKVSDTLACRIEAVGPDGLLTPVGEMRGAPPSPISVLPGEMVRPFPHLPLVDAHGRPLRPGEYRLHWMILDEHGDPLPGHYDEDIQVTPSDPGDSFVLSDIPRQMGADQDVSVKLAVQNLSGQTWAKDGPKIGYHWYYLDGTEAQWDGGLVSPLTEDVLPDKIDGTVVAKVHTPSEPGRYSLVWDLREPDGQWASVSTASKGDDQMQTLITVTGRGSAVPIDLSKRFNSDTGDFNGRGDGFPAPMLPPDGTAEIVQNPLELIDSLNVKPGPPLYPDGYYTSRADHNVMFLYPESSGKGNAIACQGQTIGLPGGSYRAIHMLAAASGDQPVTASFTLGGVAHSLTVAPWNAAGGVPTSSSPPTTALPSYTSPYRDGKSGPVLTPVSLDDDVIALDPSQHIDSIALPDAPDVKIVAITLMK